MALRLCKYSTGNDTTGDGTLGNEFKTLARALSTGFAQGDVIGLMEDEPLTARVVLPSVAAYVVTQIIGVNSLGVEDGTRRRLYGNGTLDYCFDMTTNSYTWLIGNIDFDTFTEYLFLQLGTYSYRSSMYNFSISNCKGLTNNSLFGFGNGSHFEDFELYNCTGGQYMFNTQGGHLRRGTVKNCSASHSILHGANVGWDGQNLIISNCSVSTTNYAVLSGCSSLDNAIIDRCSVSGANSYLVEVVAANGILITNNSLAGTGAKRLLRSVSAVSNYFNIAEYNNNVPTVDYYGANTGDIILGNITSLSETPYISDDGINYQVKNSFAGRRKLFDLGKFTYGKTNLL